MPQCSPPVYSPLRHPKKPFYFNGEWMNRDGMIKLGLNKEARKLIIAYTSREEASKSQYDLDADNEWMNPLSQ